MSESELWKVVQAIVDAVVGMEPFVYKDNSGDMECIFCRATHDDFLSPQAIRYHDADCIVLKAIGCVIQVRAKP
jgi:hypothetical protein